MVELRDEHGGEMVAVEFQFDVPQGGPGCKVQVRAPDGRVLALRLPENSQPGDKVVISRTDDGNWIVSHLVRPDPLPASSAPAPELPPEPRWLGQAELQRDLVESGQTVRLETTKGVINVRIVPRWAPRGAQRFMELVSSGFFERRIAIYRAVPDFLVQFGVVQGNSGWDTIEDDPVLGVPVELGSVVFAAVGPNTRRHTLCIFLRGFPQLGRKPSEAPIGKVADAASMETLTSLYAGYGDVPQAGGAGPDPLLLEERGNSYITANFPLCDFIIGASKSYSDTVPSTRLLVPSNSAAGASIGHGNRSAKNVVNVSKNEEKTEGKIENAGGDDCTIA